MSTESQPKVFLGWYESQPECIEEINQGSQPSKSARMYKRKSTKLQRKVYPG